MTQNDGRIPGRETARARSCGARGRTAARVMSRRSTRPSGAEPSGDGNDPDTVQLALTVSTDTGARCSYSRCSSIREHRHALLRIES